MAAKKTKKTAPKETPPKETPLRWGPIRFLLGGALLISLYLAWFSLSGRAAPGCGPESDCSKVLQSQWAYWLGIPVTVPAVLIYALALGATWRTNLRWSLPARQRAWSVLLICSAAILAAAVWFLGLQLLVLKSFCKFCLAAHACGATAGILAFRNVPRRQPGAQPDRSNKAFLLSPQQIQRLILVGIASLLPLIAGQVLMQKKLFIVQPLDSASPNKPASRQLPVHGGNFLLDIDQLPLIGSASAPKVLVSLFDYTCRYCRDMHGFLLDAQKRFTNDLAIITLPMPLDASCNHLMSRTSQAHFQACDLARLALAVWRAAPASFSRFDSWVFQPASPPPLEQVRTFAENLVGKEKLQQSLTNEWVGNQIKTNIAIYAANSRQAGRSSMPQLILGSALSVGPLNSVNDLFALLHQHLGLAVPNQN